MKRWIALGLTAGFFGAALAWADMVETKKDGILNGKILSESDQEIQFKGSSGQTRVFKKKDVLFMEKQDDSKTMKQFFQKALEILKNAPQKIKKMTDQWTKKFIGAVSKPLDRSAANAKSDELNFRR